MTTDALKIYSEKLGLSTTLTLEGIIESHASLREINAQRQDTWLEELNQARIRGQKEGYEHATKHDYISREDLKKMSLSELAAIVYEDE